MPESFMSLFPHLLTGLEAVKLPTRAGADLARTGIETVELGFDLVRDSCDLWFKLGERFLPLVAPMAGEPVARHLRIWQEGLNRSSDLVKNRWLRRLNRFWERCRGELEFINLFMDDPPPQDWACQYGDEDVIVDLPGLRVIDISNALDHRIDNYTIVFAPRAGNHSNIAEAVAVYMRDAGLTRMAVVEMKCADDIPLQVNGRRHYENFNGQVEQYRAALEAVRDLTGRPAHAVAICQPGPLLMSAIILHPHLAQSFGCAGSPMDTEAERGFLTDFSRWMGEDYVKWLTFFLGHTVPSGKAGAGRETYDGRLQVLGFYLLGLDRHFKNYTQLWEDLISGHQEAAQRQREFYQWYNLVHHPSLGFIQDTYRKIFINNELARGRLEIGGRTIGFQDFPPGVPVWALGGTKDEITPPLQTTAHLDALDQVPPEDKLNLLCEAGHTGLFRSRRIFESHYRRVVEFLLKRSDKTAGLSPESNYDPREKSR
ncbi:MAG: hypothetical protein KJ621_20575 [Proteobacteria bacterium]|nr:hypothetical protein [Pseudomonadota bacterium]MBU1741608.1 hypothetical protein [Pseudomonadota bacterium]